MSIRLGWSCVVVTFFSQSSAVRKIQTNSFRYPLTAGVSFFSVYSLHVLLKMLLSRLPLSRCRAFLAPATFISARFCRCWYAPASISLFRQPLLPPARTAETMANGKDLPTTSFFGSSICINLITLFSSFINSFRFDRTVNRDARARTATS